MKKEKKKKKENRQKEKESSIQGIILSQMISQVTSTYLLGNRIKTGEIRKKLHEPKWRVPEVFEVEEIQMPLFPMEFLKRKEEAREDYVILQLHGGGYIGGMRNAYRTFAGVYCEISKGMSVLTIDYRVAPEHPYPAALEDANTAFEWLLEQGYTAQQIILAGDSAGGGLALALGLSLRDQGKEMPAGMILMSPWADLTCSGISYQENYEKDPLFGNTRESLIYNGAYVQEENPENPYISPVFGQYQNFPPILIQVGSLEMLLSDSVTVAEKLKEAGGKVKLSVYEGMFHVFQMALKLLPESREAWSEIGKFLSIISKNT